MSAKFFLGAFVVPYLILLCVPSCSAHTSLYYDIVNDFNAGKNYYKVLDVDANVEDSDLRKAFRKLSVTRHPDKVGKQGEQAYLDLVRAYDVLKDPEARKEYEQLLREGVPWQDQYYGRYAYKYGAPVTDVRVGQYFSQYYKHITYTDAAKKTLRYQQALKVREHEKKIKQKQKKGKKQGPEDDDDEEEDRDDLDVIIPGAEKPQVRDVVIVKLVVAPFYIARAGYRIARWVADGRPEIQVDEDAVEREKHGMDEEEWEAEKVRSEASRQRMMESNKYKRYKRWMKKNG